MSKQNTLLKGLLITVSISSFVNVVTFFLYPKVFLLSSFSIVSHAINALLYNRIWMVVFSFLACIIMFLSAISVNKNHFVCPFLITFYFIYDIIILCYKLIITGWWSINYLIGLLQDVVFIILLCVYFYQLIALHQVINKTGKIGDDSLS